MSKNFLTMKTKSFLFSLFLLAGLVGFNSCSDDEDEQLAQADAEEVIVQADTDFGTYSTENGKYGWL